MLLSRTHRRFVVQISLNHLLNPALDALQVRWHVLFNPPFNQPCGHESLRCDVHFIPKPRILVVVNALQKPRPSELLQLPALVEIKPELLVQLITVHLGHIENNARVERKPHDRLHTALFKAYPSLGMWSQPGNREIRNEVCQSIVVRQNLPD